MRDTPLDYDKDRSIATAVAAINNSESMAEAVKAELGASTIRSAPSLMWMVGVSTSEGSDIVSISGTSTNPQEAAQVANAYSHQFASDRQNADRAAVGARLPGEVNKEISSLGATALASDYGLMLQEKYETLRILEAMQDGGFTVMREASVPGAPFTPQTQRNIILALGALIESWGLALPFSLSTVDKRVKDEKTLERVTGLPGRRPRYPPWAASGAWPGRGTARWRSLGSKERARCCWSRSGLSVPAFSTSTSTATCTRFSSPSGLPQEGKTVTTINLGISLALSGQRVEPLRVRPPAADGARVPGPRQSDRGYRRARRASVPSPGLRSSSRWTRWYRPKSALGRRGRSALVTQELVLLKMVPLPPNPAELLGSARMGQVMAELKKTADYILVDSAPLLLVSGLLILAAHVDAVMVAARLRASTRGEMEEVHNLLERAGVRAIGVVAGGVKHRRGYYHRRGYGYGYGAPYGYGYR